MTTAETCAFREMSRSPSYNRAEQTGDSGNVSVTVDGVTISAAYGTGRRVAQV